VLYLTTVLLLDLFCGRFGWSSAFAARGWKCLGVDLVKPETIPDGCTFMERDILTITSVVSPSWIALYGRPDFICASSPCEQFSAHGMKHFHKNPPYPELGLQLFNHTRALCEASGVPYVMENVRPAQLFVGPAAHRCGPFYLWGNAVPPLMAQGVKKGISFRAAPGAYMTKRPADVTVREWRNRYQQRAERLAGGRAGCAAAAATIPPELASCVADYATRLTEDHSDSRERLTG